jgi:hypothetical protein
MEDIVINFRNKVFLMRVKEGFLLREIVGDFVVVPVGQAVAEFNGLLTLSESSALIWRKLETGATMGQLVTMICSEYNIDEKTAEADITEFVEAMIARGFVYNE